MPPVFGRPLLRGGVGRLVVHQIDPLAEPRGLGRVVRVRKVGIRTRRIGTVGQAGVGDRLAGVQYDILAPLGGGDLRDREAVFGDLELLDVQRRLLFPEEEPGARHAVAQRDAPHLQRAVLHQQCVFGGVYLGPRHVVGQFAVEIAEVAGQNLSERRRGEDPQRGLAAVERQRRDEREQSENMVAVEVRDEHGADFQRIDAVADQLLLHALARIHEIILFVDVDRLGRRMPVCGGFGRRRP